MKIPPSMHSNYLISVRFENQYNDSDVQEMINQCTNFLDDLSVLARLTGKRLYSTYSVVNGKSDHHAHFTLNWIPQALSKKKYARNQFENISRYKLTELLLKNGFVVDNPKEAIKRVTHDKKHVTDYVLYQPKENQSLLFSGTYEAFVLGENHSIGKHTCNSSTRSFARSVTKSLSGCIHKLFFLLLISIVSIVTISHFLVLIL